MVGQTKYADMVNKGAYKAQINKKVCSGNDSTANASSSQQGGSSASDAPEYETWIVESTRSDNSSAQTVNVWFHEKGEGQFEPAKFMNAKVVITEAASETNPYGIFIMNFIAYAEGTTNILFKGTLKSEKDPVTGKVLLKFVDEDTSGKFREAVSLEKNSNGTGGGTAYQYENFGQGIQEGSINFTYDTNLFHRINPSNPATEACLDRTDFETSAWRYGMYDAANGSRVNVSSGFPINTSSDGKGNNGWVGFWGLWVPEGVTISDGATVYKQTYGPNGGTSAPYTVQKVPGKLKKHTKGTTTLGAIKNIPLEGYQEQVGQQNINYRVIWDATQNKLMKVASAAQSSNGPPAWQEITPVAIDTTSLNWGELNFWSQALGGQARVKLTNCQFNPQTMKTACAAPTADTQVVFFKEDIVYPGDVNAPAALACYDNCPKAGATGMDPNDLTYAQSFDPQVDNRHDYTVASMVLKDGANSVTLATAPQNQSWGFNSGPLFAPTSANMALLACDWTGPQGQTQVCGWKAWSALDEFYTWETGPNNWNQLTVLKDSNGTPLTFEQPLRVEYTHVQTVAGKPDTKYNGVKFFLDYNGFGELHGIPGKCIDMSSGLTVQDCSGSGKRWVPEFSIPEGSAASYAKAGVTYNTVIKPLEMEQRMVKLANNACSGLPITTYTLPLIAEWVDPAIGAEPSVTAAPAVIGGVVQ